MPLDNKCRIGPLAGAPPDTCAVVISTETESGFITEDDTSPVCHTPSEVGKNPFDTAYDVGSVVILADVGSSSQLRSVVSLWFLLMALDVWKECALWAGGIIGPYFFKNDEGHNVTVNGDQYRAMITNFFIPELNNHDVQQLWFQQDGATYHTARATIDLLKDTLVDPLISRVGPVNWPPRSCDLTPLDYFLWGYVKSLVYVDKL
ncbi:transposable element Tc3 transposase [Trichonephila clavipes]|nr:transposable element Tc3 transposase [Trichonephila clavipes]